MKQKKQTLTLNKNTVANLELNSLKGGIPTTTVTLTDPDKCKTFDLSNCNTWEFPICNNCDSTPCP
jgi:hypothetical protein